MPSYLRNKLLEALRDRSGNVAVLFSLAILPLIGFAGAAVDYGMMSAYRSKLQAAADTGAIQAAKELRLAQMGQSTAVATIAQTYAMSALAGSSALLSNVAVGASLVKSNTAIQVSITATYKPILLRSFGTKAVQLAAQATASSAGYPICALALDPMAPRAIHGETQARITAQFCAVQANSKDPEAIFNQGAARMTAGAICSSGGYRGTFAPAPLTDCPIVPDPLASRPPPTVGACSHTNMVVSGGTMTLLPGNYCGGLQVTNGATVTLSPGEYVISNGPLKVEGGSTFSTSGAGIYLTGAGATITFTQDTTISLTAPTSGPMAGLLIYEDRMAPTGQFHRIYSDNAPMMLGTIYLPRNQLYLETSKDVGQASAFTIVVANSIYVEKATNLKLNSDYKSSNIPVPGGLNPGYSFLTR